MCRSTGRIVLTALLWVVRLVRLAYLVRRSRFLRGFIVSVVSRSVAGSVVAGSVRIPGRYRTPIPRTLLVVAVLVVAAVASLVFGSYQMSPDQVFAGHYRFHGGFGDRCPVCGADWVVEFYRRGYGHGRYYWWFCDGGCGDASGGCARWRDNGSEDGADWYCGECDAQFRKRLPDYAR